MNHPARRISGILLLGLAVLGGCSPFNAPPVAEFVRTPAFGDAPLSVFFDATASSDADGILVSFDWDFGDGSTGSGVTTTHTYNEAGTYEAVLRVADDAGEISGTLLMVTVADPQIPLEEGVGIGQLAPSFELRDLSGDPVSLDGLRGYVVLLDFWASTCTPCRQTMAHLDGMQERFGDRGLVVVGISVDPSASMAQQFLEDNGYDRFVILHQSLAAATQVKSLYEVDAIPQTFVIDRQGIIRHIDHPIRLRDRHIEPWL